MNCFAFIKLESKLIDRLLMPTFYGLGEVFCMVAAVKPPACAPKFLGESTRTDGFYVGVINVELTRMFGLVAALFTLPL